ncbi:MAG TPA: MerR family transcriptional regulator, partial [Thermodesulfobacteriota bacterium]
MEKKSTPPIPEKLYYKIGEVSQITGVEPYVLRYWESEFKIISP